MTEIKCLNNGPLLISGDFKLMDAEENDFNLSGRKAIALCRCGSSENKPFCDGNHRKAEFSSTICARTLEPPTSK